MLTLCAADMSLVHSYFCMGCGCRLSAPHAALRLQCHRCSMIMEIPTRPQNNNNNSSATSIAASEDRDQSNTDLSLSPVEAAATTSEEHQQQHHSNASNNNHNNNKYSYAYAALMESSQLRVLPSADEKQLIIHNISISASAADVKPMLSPGSSTGDASDVLDYTSALDLDPPRIGDPVRHQRSGSNSSSIGLTNDLNALLSFDSHSSVDADSASDDADGDDTASHTAQSLTPTGVERSRRHSAASRHSADSSKTSPSQSSLQRRMTTHGSHQTKKRDPLAPKRAANAYMLFCKEQRPLLREKQPDLDFSIIGATLGDMWRTLPAEQKKPYEDAAVAERARYKTQMNNYTASALRTQSMYEAEQDAAYHREREHSSSSLSVAASNSNRISSSAPLPPHHLYQQNDFQSTSPHSPYINSSANPSPYPNPAARYHPYSKHGHSEQHEALAAQLAKIHERKLQQQQMYHQQQHQQHQLSVFHLSPHYPSEQQQQQQHQQSPPALERQYYQRLEDEDLLSFHQQPRSPYNTSSAASLPLHGQIPSYLSLSVNDGVVMGGLNMMMNNNNSLLHNSNISQQQQQHQNSSNRGGFLDEQMTNDSWDYESM